MLLKHVDVIARQDSARAYHPFRREKYARLPGRLLRRLLLAPLPENQSRSRRSEAINPPRPLLFGIIAQIDFPGAIP
jgi:hypothetical protein